MAAVELLNLYEATRMDQGDEYEDLSPLQYTPFFVREEDFAEPAQDKQTLVDITFLPCCICLGEVVMIIGPEDENYYTPCWVCKKKICGLCVNKGEAIHESSMTALERTCFPP